jgi:hypothetical protein
MLMQITEGSLTSHVKPMAKSPNAGCQKWNLVLAHILFFFICWLCQCITAHFHVQSYSLFANNVHVWNILSELEQYFAISSSKYNDKMGRSTIEL